MNNYYVIEIQTNADGTSGILPFGFPDEGATEGKYLALREAARQSSVLIHTVMAITNKGLPVSPKMPPVSYIHPASEPEQAAE